MRRASSLVGVTYHDPDGDLAYCYNSEVASMRLNLWDRTSRGRSGWVLRETLVADGTAHFEYAQRAPVDGVELLVTVSFRAAGEHLAIDLPGATALFTTRRGGVSEGPYASLNLGLATDDDPERVAANRERVREHAGAARLAQGRQVHGTHVVVDGEGGEEADGQVTTRPGVAAIVLDGRLPAGRAGGPRRRRRRPRGLARAGRRRARGGRRAPSGAGPVAAAIGPGIGPCCYEVGDDVRAVFASSERTLDLKAVARARLQAAGVAGDPRLRPVHGVRSAALLLPSPRPRRHRPPGGARMAQLIRGLDARRVADNLARVRAEIGREDVEILAAVKYVAAEEMGVLAEAGVTLVGENRAQELEVKAAAACGADTWDFIGHLQSRKVKQILPHVRWIHSVASDSVLKELGKHAGARTRGARRGQRGPRREQVRRAARGARRLPGALSGARRGADDDAAVHRAPGGQPPLVRGAGAAGGRARAARAVDGHEPGLRGRRPGGRDDCATRHESVYVSCRRIAQEG